MVLPPAVAKHCFHGAAPTGLSIDNISIPTIGRFDVSLQQPTTTNTTIANHGRQQQKWPPSTPHKALHSMLMHCMDGRQSPKQVGIIFWDDEGVYGPQKTPMLWWFIIAWTKEHFEGHTHLQQPKKLYLLAWGLPTIHLMRRCRAQGLMCGARRLFLLTAAVAVSVVMPVVFVLRLLKNAIKTLKLVTCKQCLFLLLYIVKHIAIHVTLIVVWPESKQLWSNCRKALNVTKTVASLYWGRNIGIKEIERNHCWPCN